MRKIAIINQKGGVGKTTTTANLGAALALAGKRVLLIDLDPQGHLTLHLGVELSEEHATIYDVLTGESKLADALLRPRDRLALVPADIDLAAAEAELVSVTGREVLLREAVAGLPESFDVLVIDCPPSLGVLTINALAAADEVLVPLQAHFFGLQGMSKLFDTVMLVRQRINPALTISGIALCMHEANTKHAAEVADDLGRFLESARGDGKPWSKANLYKTRIRRNIKLAESSSFGQTVFDYAPKSNGAIDYANLAAEVFSDIDVRMLTHDAASPAAVSTPAPPVATTDATEVIAPPAQPGPTSNVPMSCAGAPSDQALRPRKATPKRSPKPAASLAANAASTPCPTVAAAANASESKELASV